MIVGLNPHPQRSGLKVTPKTKNFLIALRMLRRRWLGRVAAHAIDFDVFSEMMNRHDNMEAHFIWAKQHVISNAVFGQGKYHVLVKKTT